MSVEVNVVNMRCGAQSGGLSCTYCYESTVRRSQGNAAPIRVDHEAVQRQLLKVLPPKGKARHWTKGFSLFGGEPLLAPIEDLERLWAFGLKTYGKNGVQTSGRPITEEHLELFKRYRVHVGFSIDGPGELNDARRAGTLDETRAATAHSEAMLRRCKAEGIGCSVIVTLHRLNASRARLPRLLSWFRELDRIGITSARLHILELDGHAGAIALTSEQNLEVLLAMRSLERELAARWTLRRVKALIARRRFATLQFDLFRDMLAKLRDPNADATCVWNGCDPWSTPAVHGIDADGERSMCTRVHKDGKEWIPLDGAQPRVRQVVLWNTPQEDGGCHGCRFFLQCGGHCPGTAIDGDWRKRTVDCRLWFGILEHLEAEMLSRGQRPASRDRDLAQRIEQSLMAGMGRQRSGEYGDHNDHGDHNDVDAVAEHLSGGEVVR